MRTESRIYVLGAVLLVAACAMCVQVGWGTAQPWAVPAFMVAVAIAGFATVRVVFGRQSCLLALTDALVAVVFLLAPGAWIVLGFVLGFVLAYARRLTPLKIFFNVCQYAFALSVGLLVTNAVGSGVIAAATGLIVFAVLNHALVTVPIAMTTGRSYRTVLAQTGRLNIIHEAGNLSIGLLAGWLAQNAPWGLLGLTAPLALLWWSYRQQTERTAEARLFAELASGQKQASTTSLDISARVILSAAARLFGGAEVELLLRHPEGPVRYVGDENGVTRRERVDAAAFAAAWVLRTMGARGVRIGTENERPYCSSVLGDPDRPLAVMIARRAPRAGGFERLDARLAQVLVGQAEAWLSVAELATRHGEAVGKVVAYGDANRALGDLGAYTAPALVVLRESTDRLSRLAYSMDGPDPVRDIVDELHSVERAVASLLGAVALASEPDLVTRGVATRQHVGRVDSEWTTTGRLDASETQ